MKAMKELVIGADVKTIGSDAFSYCDGLETVTFEGKVETMGQGIVFGSTNIKIVNLPAGWSKEAFKTVAIQSPYNFGSIGGFKTGFDTATYVVGGVAEPAFGTELEIIPLYGQIENWAGGTYFFVGVESSDNDKLFNNLKNGTWKADFVIKDETTKTAKFIKGYAFDNPTHKFYGTSFLRIAVCNYGIIPVVGHTYTVIMNVYESGKCISSGTSQTGAFANFNDAFKENGPIVPNPIPHTSADCDYNAKPGIDPEIIKPHVEITGTCGDNLTWTLNTETGVLDITGSGDMKNYTSDVSVPWYSYHSSIKTVNIGNGVTSIGDGAFYDCSSLTSVTIGNGVTSIRNWAFKNCTSLTIVTIPDSVTSIGDSAFSGCSSLTIITIPDNVISMGSSVFNYCTGLKTIYCEATSQPSGWNSNWKGNCNAEVIWGYSAHICTPDKEATCTEDSICTVCGKVVEAAKGHNFCDWIEVKAGGCSLENYHVRFCLTLNCGYLETDLDGDVLHAHEWIIEHKEATCTEDGYRNYFHCANCDKEEYKEVIPAFGHKDTEWQYNDEQHYKYCPRCGEYYDEDNHNWSGWITDKASSCTEIGTKHRSCTICGCLQDGTIPIKPHSYGTWIDDDTNHWKECSECGDIAYIGEHTCNIWKVTIPETCLNPGKSVGECKICGHKMEKETPALGHNVVEGVYDKNDTHHWLYCTRCDYTERKETHIYDDWAIVQPLTCTQDQIEERICTICGGGVQTRTTQTALGHQYNDEWTFDNTYHWKVCTRTGCGHIDNIKAHSYGEWIVTKAPTCTQTGERYKVCECEYRITEKIGALGHEWSEEYSYDDTYHWKVCVRECIGYKEKHSCINWKTVIPATCLDPGKAVGNCDICGYPMEKEIPALGHDYTGAEWSYDGINHWKECNGCGEKKDIDEHICNNWTTETEATCLNPGKAVGNCEICGYPMEKEIPVLDHDYTGAEWSFDGINHWRECNRCGENGYTGKHICNNRTTEIEATCLNPGKAVGNCKICGYPMEEEIPALGHDYTGVKWSYDGINHWKVCARTGCEHIDHEEAHSYGDWVIVQELTCTQDQIEERICKICKGGVQTRTTQTALGHQYDEWTFDNTYHWKICTRTGCEHIDYEEAHSYGEWIVTKAPTCTLEGERYKLCECGYKLTEKISPLGHEWSEEYSYDDTYHWKVCVRGCIVYRERHNYADWVETKIPSCSVEGEQQRSCSECGYVQTKPLPPSPHEDSEWLFNDEQHYKYCSNCGEYYGYEDHVLTDWIIDKESSCTEDGKKHRSCTVCEYREDVTIPPSHILIQKDAKDATCTKPGYKAYEFCIRCDYTTYEELPALGHNVAEGVYRKNNTSHWLYCTRCDYIEQKEDHTYGEWGVIRSPGCTIRGERQHSCSECGYVETEYLPALGHVDGEWLFNDEQHYKYCPRCGTYYDHKNHNLQIDNIVKATCEKNGYTEYHCTDCNKQFRSVEDATGHKPSNGWFITNDTHYKICTNSGCNVRLYESEHNQYFFGSDNTHHWYRCSVCGKISVKEEHTYGEWKTVRAATCTWTGLQERYCTNSNCNHKQSNILPKLPHDSYADVETEQVEKDGVIHVRYIGVILCHNCSYREVTSEGWVHIHNDVKILEVHPATCTEPGWLIYTCIVEGCGDQNRETIPAAGHSYVDGVCIVCGSVEIISSGSCGINGDNVIWTFYANGVLDIIGEGEMCDYSLNDSPWCSYIQDIETVNIGKGVTSIGSYAFYGCNALTSITIHDSVTTIGSWAFYGCGSLTSITLPNSITRIQPCTFYACGSLANINIPNGVTSIGSYAFSGCTGLTSITIPESVTSIGSWAFAYCTGITNITIPDSVMNMGSNVFTNCNRLEVIYCKAATQPIGWDSEWNDGCNAMIVWEPVIKNGFITEDGILYYYINGDIQYGWLTIDGIKYYASFETGAVTSGTDAIIYTKQYFWIDGEGLVLADGFHKNIGTNIYATLDPTTGVATLVTVSTNGIICFDDGYLMYGWRHADGSPIRVVDGVYEQYSPNPDNLYYFLTTTFTMVTDDSYVLGGWLREFNEDHTVKPMNGVYNRYGTVYAYDNGVRQYTTWYTDENTGNRYYITPNGTAAVSWQIIDGKLYYFNSIGSYLKTSGAIGGINYRYAADGSILATGFINIDYSKAMLNNTADYIGKLNETTRYYLNGVMQTGWQTINGNTYYFYKESGYICLESRTIGGIYHYQIAPDGRVLYGLYFTPSPDRQSYYLSGIDIKSSTDIVVPSTYNGLPVTAINDYALKEQSITSITIPDSVVHIGSYAFYGCPSLTSAVIGNNVTSISYSAFAYCYNLSSVTLGRSVRNIGAYAFYGTSISSIVLPSSVTGISAEAFGGCTSLGNIYYSGSQTDWSNINIDSNNDILISANKQYNYTR